MSPEIVQTAVVSLTTVTGSPELADGAGLRVIDPAENGVAGIAGKVMV